jgi:hypothetical protein
VLYQYLDISIVNISVYQYLNISVYPYLNILVYQYLNISVYLYQMLLGKMLNPRLTSSCAGTRRSKITPKTKLILSLSQTSLCISSWDAQYRITGSSNIAQLLESKVIYIILNTPFFLFADFRAFWDVILLG